ncbi:MAG: flagellar export protein FliJ [Phycisphaerales bacterium]|nr:flagellar export protein FliJ [Phycisphaerales bacterium]MCB9857040.1 flagellar export protein FliJ [Phycisphaerales bacterium]MCB9861833.1 flagellar export protein FliJ [Phycisphaerales bacterium]
MASNEVFRFETLLKLRRQKEDEAKRALASRIGQIRDLEERQKALQSRIDQQSTRSRQILGEEALRLDELRLSRHWVTRLRQGLLQAEAEMRTQRAILAAERTRLADASKDRKVLARLKERRLDRYFAEQQRREQAEMDEMNVLRFAYARLDEEQDAQ